MEPTATGDGDRDDANATPVDTTTRLAWLRTVLAADRTLMAWNRTSLALIGFGFTIYSFLRGQEEGGRAAYPAHTPRNAGLVALWQHRLYTRYLQGHPDINEIALREGMPRASLALVVTVFLTVIGMVTIGWFVLTG